MIEGTFEGVFRTQCETF